MCSKSLLNTDISQQFENGKIYGSNSLRMLGNDYCMFIPNNLVFPCFCLLTSLIDLFVRSLWIYCAGTVALISQPLFVQKILVEVIRLCEIITICGSRGCHVMSDPIWAAALFFPSSYVFCWKINEAMQMTVTYCEEEYVSLFLSSCIMCQRDSCFLPYYEDTDAY